MRGKKTNQNKRLGSGKKEENWFLMPSQPWRLLLGEKGGGGGKRKNQTNTFKNGKNQNDRKLKHRRKNDGQKAKTKQNTEL